MDIVSRISTPDFRNNIEKIITTSELLNEIDGAEYIARITPRDAKLMHNIIINKIKQDISRKNEINNQRLVHDIVLSILLAQRVSSKKMDVIYNTIIVQLDRHLHSPSETVPS